MKFNQFFKEDEDDQRKVSVFDFDGTLIALKDRIYEIFNQKWVRGPKDINWDAPIDWSNWEDEDLFVLDPTDAEFALAEARGIDPLTHDEIDMFVKYWRDERFIRPVPKYKKFFTGKYAKSPSNGSALQKYYTSTRTLDPALWNILHVEGPVLNIAKDRANDAENHIVYVLTARDEDQEMRYAIQDLLDHFDIRLPEFRIRMVDHENAPAEKARVLGELVDKFPHTEIDFFDDREDYIAAASRVPGVNAIQV